VVQYSIAAVLVPYWYHQHHTWYGTEHTVQVFILLLFAKKKQSLLIAPTPTPTPTPW
jgi:hypothetical protein